MSKIKSRKLWAFIVWAVLIAIGLIMGKTVTPELLQWFGTVTVIYIGGQSAIDTVAKLKGKDE